MHVATATFTALGAVLALGVAAPAVAKPTAQTTHCATDATRQNLTGAARAEFIKTCQKGPLVPAKPTGPTAASPEAQAVTKPSGVDRTTRTKQCAAEADKKYLASKARKDFQLSCLATAGPVTEAGAGTMQPKPGKAIAGIGENNYKATGAATSKPEHNPPAAAKPKP